MSKEQDGAIWLAMMDLYEYINMSAVAKDYFNRSSSWILQRMRGCKVNGKEARFKEEEIETLCKAFRDIARKLETAADNIERKDS